jgi:hypothetical protein
MKKLGLLLSLCLCVACTKKPAAKAPTPDATKPAEPPTVDTTQRTAPTAPTTPPPKGDPCDGGEKK